MDMGSQKQKAETLLALHSDGEMLLLPNVWNPIGARVLERQGYPAVATASAAISASLGYQDGEKLLRSTMIDVVGRIARTVDVPVTADMEAGYGGSLDDLAVTTDEVIACGVVGLNLEDSLHDGSLRNVDDQSARIAAVRQAAERRGIHLVINARVDCFIHGPDLKAEEKIEAAESRARAYRAAGADCVYPIGPGDEATVQEFRRRIEGPINVIASPAAAPLSVLRAIGVNRVSFGPFLFRAWLKQFVRIGEELRAGGDFSCLGETITQLDAAQYVRPGREEKL